MQITKLTIHNVGIIEHFDMPVNKSLNLFYGDIKQGKTTILNAIRWAFGGEYPADIMRHGQTEAFVEISAVDDGVEVLIRREWYVNKDGQTTNRPLVFQRAGVEQPRPAETLKRFLNPFVMDDRYFVDMTDLEKGRYLCRLFNVDTKADDKAIGEMAEEASQLRIKIKSYGEIIPVEVLPVDTTGLTEERKRIVAACEADRDAAGSALEKALGKYNAECLMVDVRNGEARKVNENRATVIQRMDTSKERRRVIQAELDEIENNLAKGEAWLQDHKERSIEPTPEKPDVSALEALRSATPDVESIDLRIQRAGATNEQHKQYLRDSRRHAEKEGDERHLIDLERQQAQLKADKVAKLSRIGAESGIPSLVFLDGGDFQFDGTSSAMLSDSQQMALTEYLKGKYPEGFNVSLIDRGESLGKSVMTLVDRAKDRKSTIFCSVVGERPATVPAEVGAFVVEKGKVTL